MACEDSSQGEKKLHRKYNIALCTPTDVSIGVDGGSHRDAHAIIPLREPRRAMDDFYSMRDSRLIIAAIGECWRHMIRPIEEEGFPQDMFAALLRLETRA